MRLIDIPKTMPKDYPFDFNGDGEHEVFRVIRKLIVSEYVLLFYGDGFHAPYGLRFSPAPISMPDIPYKDISPFDLPEEEFWVNLDEDQFDDWVAMDGFTFKQSANERYPYVGLIEIWGLWRTLKCVLQQIKLLENTGLKSRAVVMGKQNIHFLNKVISLPPVVKKFFGADRVDSNEHILGLDIIRSSEFSVLHVA